MERLRVNLAFDIVQNGSHVTFGPIVSFSGDIMVNPLPVGLRAGTHVEVLYRGAWINAEVERGGTTARLDHTHPRYSNRLVVLALEAGDEDRGARQFREAA